MNHRGPLTAIAVALMLAVLAAGCSSEDDDGNTGAAPIVQITNFWTDLDDPDHGFQFNATSADSATSGTFAGFEERNSAVVDTLDGDWNFGRIRFTLRQAQVTYSASGFPSDPDTLAFYSTQGTLRIGR